jgi:hypothetical protein
MACWRKGTSLITPPRAPLELLFCGAIGGWSPASSMVEPRLLFKMFVTRDNILFVGFLVGK